MEGLSKFYPLPLGDWIQSFITQWLVPNFGSQLRLMIWPVRKVMESFDQLLHLAPMPVVLILAGLIAWKCAGRSVGILTAVCILLLDMLGVLNEAKTTFAMVLTALVFCIVIGLPIGIACARSDRIAAIVRPILDVMQTVPSFVYLVPIVMLFGIGLVPGVVATIIFSLPPIIRLTNLGIREVPKEIIEAATAFGSTPRQILLEAQIPMAMPTIMMGVNQTLMMSLSMVVMAALIGAEGLGYLVYTGIGRLNVGAASLGGIGIVLMAIVLDRITQAIGSRSAAAARNSSRSWLGLKKRSEREERSVQGI
jgi:glycine betaine/proline transport system permease protein